MEPSKAEELVQRLAAALRGADLYSPTHPVVQRGIDALAAAASDALDRTQAVVVGFVGDDVVVDSARLSRGTASLAGLARDLREREIDKITLSQGLTRDEIRGFVAGMADRGSPVPLSERLTSRGVRRISLGKIVVDDADEQPTGIVAAKRVRNGSRHRRVA